MKYIVDHETISFNTSTESCHITPILYALSPLAQNTERIEYNILSLIPTKLSQLPNLHIFIASSLFNVIAVLALHPSLLLLGHLHHPV